MSEHRPINALDDATKREVAIGAAELIKEIDSEMGPGFALLVGLSQVSFAAANANMSSGNKAAFVEKLLVDALVWPELLRTFPEHPGPSEAFINRALARVAKPIKGDS